MHRKSRRVLFALVGCLAVAGPAAAQAPAPASAPQPLPPLPALPATPLVPEVTPATAREEVRPTSGGPVSEPVGPPVVAGSRPSLSPLHAPIPYGQYGPGYANGCGSCKSTTGFIFGSCRSFFEPCGPVPGHGLGLGAARFGCRPCGIHPFGQPYNKGINGCTYDSYVNH